MSFGSYLMCLVLICISGAACSAAKAADAQAIGLDAFCRLDLLADIAQEVRVGSFSSYDRTGGNDDGFSGTYSFLRETPEGKVVAEMDGPGMITRIWTATPNDDIVDFYLDGEASPRISIKFRDMFTGTNYPFLAPLAGRRIGGYYSYAPIAYAKSCKVVVRGGFYFYQINYATFAEGSAIKTFEPKPSAEYTAQVRKIGEVFNATGADASRFTAPPGSRVKTAGKSVTVRPGKAAVLFESRKPGRIVGLRMTPAEVFAGDDRGLLLRVTWDGERGGSWVCPVGDFFGYAWGEPATRSLLIGTNGGANYCYFPMPYDKSAKIEVVSTRQSGLPVALYAEVLTSDIPRRGNEGKFYAVWRREKPTIEGKPFTFIEATGRGKVVGSVLQAQGDPYNMGFFEGDDQTIVDGKLQIHGTGSEDFFNGGWYDVPGRWIMQDSLPLSGCLGYSMPLGRTGGYRLMISDAYRFDKSIHHAIEHDAEGNRYVNDYCGVSYLYADAKPMGAADMPSPEMLAVAKHDSVSFRGNKLLLDDMGGANATIRRDGEGRVVFAADGGYITFACNMLEEGDYRVFADLAKGPDGAIVQLNAHDTPAGDAVDLYSKELERIGGVELGLLNLKKGPNAVMIKLVGRNENSGGMRMEIGALRFTRVD